MSNVVIAPVNGTVLTIDPIPNDSGWIVTFRGEDGRVYTYTLDTVFVSMCQTITSGTPIGSNDGSDDSETTGNFIWNQYQDTQPAANAWIDGIFRAATVGIGMHPVYSLDVAEHPSGVSGRFAGRVKGLDAEEDDEFITLAQFNALQDEVILEPGSAFNPSSGVLTLIQTGDTPDLDINFDGRYVPLARMITLTQTTGISISGNASQALSGDVAWTIGHADTSNQADVSTTGANVIGSLGFDTFGHVISVATRTISAADIGHIINIADSTTNRFQVGHNQSLRFVPTGNATVGFDVQTKTVYIGFTPGAGDGNNYTTGQSWDASTGNLTTQRSGLTALQTNLDGRYLTSNAHNHSIGNAAGANQFNFGVGDMIRFAGSGVTFTPGSKTISFNFLTSEGDPIANAKTISLIQGSGITLTGTQAQTLGNNPFWTITHADTSNVVDTNFGGATVLGSLTFDGFGHVTGVGTRSLTAADIGAEASGHLHYIYNQDFVSFSYGAGQGARFIAGNTGLVVSLDTANKTVVFYHNDTSDVGNVNIGGASVIGAMSFDNYGHVTGVAARNLTAADIGAVTSISHEHIVQDGNGTIRFVYNIGEGIRFFGINGASVDFDANVRGVIFNANTFARADWGVTYARRGINITSGTGIQVSAVDAPADNETRFTVSTTPCVNRRSVVVAFDKPNGIQVGDKFVLLIPTTMMVLHWYVTFPDGPYNAGNMSVSFDLKQSYYTSYPNNIYSMVGPGIKPNLPNSPGITDYKNSSSPPSGWYTTQLGENHYLIVECVASSGVATNCSVHLLCEITCGALS